MIELHTISPPAWMLSLVDDVLLGAVRPLGFIGHLGYRAWDPGSNWNDFPGWQLAVFPVPHEIRGATPHDGRRQYAGFNLDIDKVAKAFSVTDAIEWNCPANPRGDLDGPEISIVGTFAGHRVRLRVFSQPPPDEPISHYIDPAQGVITPAD